jgi:hypothetical protein
VRRRPAEEYRARNVLGACGVSVCVIARLGAVLSVFAILIGNCTGPDVDDPTRLFVSDEVPRSVPIPSGWQASTNRSEPDPRLRVGLLSTHITNVRYSFDQSSLGPNSGPGASEKLGPSTAVVRVLLFWSPADDSIEWNPADSSTTIARSPTGWHDDAQNPGWEFRERKVCLAETCVWVVEWHGPDPSEEAIGWIERIAQSLELAPGWTDPVAQFPRRRAPTTIPIGPSRSVCVCTPPLGNQLEIPRVVSV